MSEKNDVTQMLRAQLKGAHDWLEGTLAGVTNELANVVPSGKVSTIGAQYAHIVTFEDFMFNAAFKGGVPLMMTAATGLSSPPPMGPWGEWGRSVKVDLADQQAYAQQVYGAGDAYLAALKDSELERSIQTQFGTLPMAEYLKLMILNAHVHAGEISCLKGQHSLQGYPM